MFAATSRSDCVGTGASDAAVIRGRAEVGFRSCGGETRLTHLFQHDPLRILFPRPAPGEPITAAVVTTSGGLVGGDRLDIEIELEADATALVTQQAAEKIYRSTGADCHVNIHLTVGGGGWLEWLPQETILYEGARLRRVTAVNLAPGARLMAGEMLVFGRRARGEQLTRGLVHDGWQVHRDGKLIWADALHLDGDVAALLAHPACFGGAAAHATLVYGGDDAAGWLETARCLIAGGDDGLRAGATLVNGLLVARWIGADPFALRRAYGEFWAAFRNRVAVLPPALPRLWHV